MNTSMTHTWKCIVTLYLTVLSLIQEKRRNRKVPIPGNIKAKLIYITVRNFSREIPTGCIIKGGKKIYYMRRKERGIEKVYKKKPVNKDISFFCGISKSLVFPRGDKWIRCEKKRGKMLRKFAKLVKRGRKKEKRIEHCHASRSMNGISFLKIIALRDCFALS